MADDVIFVRSLVPHGAPRRTRRRPLACRGIALDGAALDSV